MFFIQPDEPDRDQRDHEDVPPVRGFRNRKTDLHVEEGPEAQTDREENGQATHPKDGRTWYVLSGLKVSTRRHVALVCERAHDLLIDSFPPCIHNERRIPNDNLDTLSKDLQATVKAAVISDEIPF